jgi:hypothetical protein
LSAREATGGALPPRVPVSLFKKRIHLDPLFSCAALLHAFIEDFLRKSNRNSIQRTLHGNAPPAAPQATGLVQGFCLGGFEVRLRNHFANNGKDYAHCQKSAHALLGVLRRVRTTMAERVYKKKNGAIARSKTFQPSKPHFPTPALFASTSLQRRAFRRQLTG